MIFDTPTLRLPLTLHADLCVVGSGAGGSAAATLAAEAGMRVVVLEAGEFLTPQDMSQREQEMFPRLYWESGGRMTADRSVRVHQGRGVGGSTLHNLNLCKRIPRGILEAWHRDHRLDHLPLERWDALYRETEALLSVSEAPAGMRNRHNRLLEDGCRALGWAGGGLRHNRTGCIGSGFCEVGCAYDAKNNAAKVLLPRLVKAGGEVLTACQAIRIRHRGGRALGVTAVVIRPEDGEVLGEVHVDAPRVCLSASATGTPALLHRSGVPDPAASAGNGLRVHPALVVAGEFDEPVHAWMGIPQTYECTEWLDLDREDGPREWIVPAFAHPVGTATSMPGYGTSHRELMERYAHLAVLTAMVHDHTRGQVTANGDLGLRIRYWPEEGDRRRLVHGLWACARLLQAAGARRLFVPGDPPRVLAGDAPLDDLREIDLRPGMMDVTSVHPMASVPMDDDPKRAAVGSDGKHHHLDGVWIADGSLFPTSIGVPPQLSIYALGLHVGRAIATHASG